MPSSAPAWTPDRVERLSSLWLEGQSASEIAAALKGGLTRNAILGKIHRLGLSNRRPITPRPVRVVPPPRLRPALQRPVQRRPHVERACISTAPQPQPSSPTEGTATILSVTRHACRWPFGDPLSEGFRLCGRATTRGTFCAEHGAIAYRPRPSGPDSLLKLAHLR